MLDEPTSGFSLPEQEWYILRALLVIPRDCWSPLVIRFYVEFEWASLRVLQHLAGRRRWNGLTEKAAITARLCCQ